jgi:hypothetical protein
MTEKTKKARPKPQPKCPRADIINVVQFQFFDNGENPGRGLSRHVVKLEVHCENRYVPSKPYWKRSVSMLEPKKFFEWIDSQVFDEVVTKQYAVVKQFVEVELADEDVEWIKLGHVEDTRLRDRYPGQFVGAMKLESGPLRCWLQLGDDPMPADAMFFNKAWRKGSKARLFAGTYDPQGMYEASKREQAQIAAASSKAAPDAAEATLGGMPWE